MSEVIIRRYGAQPGAPGVTVVERSGVAQISEPRYGACWFLGLLKRGPMGVAVPLTSYEQYSSIYGDPRDGTWHLFPNGAHLTPDAIDGFFKNAGGSGMLWVTRLDLDGSAKKASVHIKNRAGVEVLKIEAANEGRWGGRKNAVPLTPIIVASARTFTLYAPNTMANEYVDAEASFEQAPGKRYRVIANTKSDARSGEAIFTVAPQYNLLTDGISGPTTLTGTVSYSRYLPITGTIAYSLFKNLTGTIRVANNTLIGTGTSFLTELQVGANVYFADEARVVMSITSDTTLTLSDVFTAGNATAQTLQTDNLTVVGTTTTFNQIPVGTTLYVTINGVRQGRRVASVESGTSLTLASGFTAELSAGTSAEFENRSIVGVGTNFTTEVQIGDHLIDPFRGGAALRVVSIQSATGLTVESAFSANYTSTEIAKQAKSASVLLDSAIGNGLEVQIGLSDRFPETHFSLRLLFNATQVLYIPDASLERSDPLFIEDVVQDTGENIAYRSSGENILKWVSIQSLWNSAYTTNPVDDVRPVNGGGVALAVSKTRLYTIAALDYNLVLGQPLFVSPYQDYRSSVRMKSGVAPIVLDGDVSTSGTTVTGTSTNFLSSVVVGDYLYSPHTKEARRVQRVLSDTSLILESGYTTNAPADTVITKSGYLEVGEGNDITLAISTGDIFTVSYPKQLEGGYDGDTGATIPYYWTKYLDVDKKHIENAVFGRNLGLVRCIAPGNYSTSVNKAGCEYAEAASYEFRCELPHYLTTASSAESYLKQELGRSDFGSVAIPSYIYIQSPFGSGRRLVPANGHILGGESRFAGTYRSYHVPFAGRRAKLAGAVALPFEVPRSDEAIANTAGMQMLKFVEGNIVVWGIRQPSLSDIFKHLHIRRMQSHYNRLFLEADALQELLFRPNDTRLVAELEMALRLFARSEYEKGCFSNYVTLDQAIQINVGQSGGQGGVGSSMSDTDKLVEIINGVLTVNIRFTPTGALERLVINTSPNVAAASYGKSLSQG